MTYLRPLSRMWMLAAGLIALLGFTLPLTSEAQSCGGQCQAVCINGCNSGHHYSWQQFVCVQDNDNASGRCDDGYACSFGSCGGAGERLCNTASTGCWECFSGYYPDRGGINEYSSFNIDGVAFCGPSARCQPGCQEAVNIPNPDDITFYVTGEMEFGRTGNSSDPFHDRHVRILNNAGNGGTTWPINASGGAVRLAPPVAIVMAGDMTLTDQNDSWTTTKCDRLKELRLRYDHDRFRRRSPEKNILFPVFPGLGNHDVCKPGSCGRPSSGGTWGELDQNFIMTQYMDTRLLNSSGGRCLGVTNYDGPETKQGASTSQYGWKSHNYSWDWGRYHLVQGNVWAGYLTNGDLSWLENDLRTHVGSSGRPVIYIQHFGWQKQNSLDSWSNDERERLFQILDQYNVIALIHGHNDPDMGESYTVTHGTKTYKVFEIPQSGKETVSGGHAGFLAVRLRPGTADFSFFHYSSSSDTLTSTDAYTHYNRFPFACKGPTSGDWVLTRGTGISSEGFRACRDDPFVPQGYRFAAPANAAEQQGLDQVRGGASVWGNTGNAQPPQYWVPGEPNGGRNENCAMIYSGGSWNDAGCSALTMPFVCKSARDWRVTLRWGVHSDGMQACKADFGEGYRFSAPVSAEENSNLATALAGGFAWLNLTDEAVEGVWAPRPNHVMQRAAAYQSDKFHPTFYPAIHAIDGTLSITHTNNTSATPWIEIDLGGLKEIEVEGITVWNRVDCCQQRLANFWVVTSKVPFGPNDAAYPLSANSPSAEYVYHYTGTPPLAAVIPMGSWDRPGYYWDRRARYVRIQLDRADYLSVAGIEVRGKSVCDGGGCSSARLIAHYAMEEPLPRNQSPLLAALDVPANKVSTEQTAVGRIGGSHHFDGSTHYLNAGGSGRFDSESGTLMAWIYPQWLFGTAGINPTILGIRNGASTRLSVHVSSDYNWIGVWNGSVVNVFDVSQLAGRPILALRWSHVAVTYGSGNISLYVNGVLVGTQPGAPGSVSGLELNIGWNGGGGTTLQSERFQGYIDEVRAFDGVLTPGEIADFAVGSL